MSVHHRSLFLVISGSAALAVASIACNSHSKPFTPTAVEMQQMDYAKAHYGSHMTDMADNALLQDMCVADFHFVAHTSELSGTGVHRLDRMAVLLNTYGGTVRYETNLRDEELVKKRLDHVREYLAVAGCNMDRVEVKTMLSGGRGMAADKAIIVDLKGTAKPKSTDGMPSAAAVGSQN